MPDGIHEEVSSITSAAVGPTWSSRRCVWGDALTSAPESLALLHARHRCLWRHGCLAEVVTQRLSIRGTSSWAPRFWLESSWMTRCGPHGMTEKGGRCLGPVTNLYPKEHPHIKDDCMGIWIWIIFDPLPALLFLTPLPTNLSTRMR